MMLEVIENRLVRLVEINDRLTAKIEKLSRKHDEWSQHKLEDLQIKRETVEAAIRELNMILDEQAA